MTDNPNTRRVVVTGLGVMSALGQTVDDYWDGLVSGKSGVTPLSLKDIDAYPCRIGAEVQDFDPSDFVDRMVSRRPCVR